MKHYSNCTFLSRGAPCNCPTPTNNTSWEQFKSEWIEKFRVMQRNDILPTTDAQVLFLGGFANAILLHHDQELIEKINGRIRGFDPGDKTGTGVAFESGYDQALTDIIEIIKSNTL